MLFRSFDKTLISSALVYQTNKKDKMLLATYQKQQAKSLKFAGMWNGTKHESSMDWVIQVSTRSLRNSVIDAASILSLLLFLRCAYSLSMSFELVREDPKTWQPKLARGEDRYSRASTTTGVWNYETTVDVTVVTVSVDSNSCSCFRSSASLSIPSMTEGTSASVSEEEGVDLGMSKKNVGLVKEVIPGVEWWVKV